MNRLHDAINRRILVAISYALTLLLVSLILIQGLLQHHRVENLKSVLLNLAQSQEQALAAEMFMNQTFAISMRVTEFQKLDTATQHIDATLYDLNGRTYYTTRPPSQQPIASFPAALPTRGDVFDLNWRKQSLTVWHRILLNDQPYGVLCLELRDHQLGPLAGGTVLIAVIGTVLLVLVVVIFLLRDFVQNVVVHRLQTISTAASRIETSKDCADPIVVSGNDEITTLASQFNQMLIRLHDAQQREIEYQKLSAIDKIAAQVAHDIRSPLAALDSVMRDLSQLPEDKRSIIRSAVGRIRDIANNLIETNRETKAAIVGASGEAAASVQSATPTMELISSHIEPLITEKRLQFRSKIGIEIESRLDAASYGLFADIQAVEFKRILSNLVDNAVEALKDKGWVRVRLALTGQHVVISVEDNGRGIPPEILARLGHRGETHGKAGGSGLGLYHAKTCVEAWGGSLAIESSPSGTTVRIELPRGVPPRWFVSRLKLEPAGKVVIFDDDTSIHQVWKGRLDSLRVEERGVETFHFSTPEELRRWVLESPDNRKALFLMDYEILGHEQNGLSLAKELGLGSRVILVTSRFEEKPILDQCLRLGARMIPKGLAGFVPVDFQGPLKRPAAILIDDDQVIRRLWGLAAQAEGRELVSFSSPAEFLDVADDFDKATTIYVDSKLGIKMKGEEFAKDLHARGFESLLLTTGLEKDSFPPMPWIKEIVGKEAPWEASAA